MPTINSDTTVGIVSITLSSTDLENLLTTPITALPAPGSGLMYNILSVDWIYTFGTTGYTHDSVNLMVTQAASPFNQNDGGVWSTSEVIASGDGVGASFRATQSNTHIGVNAVLSDFVNTAVYIGQEELTTALSGGNGTLTVILTYVVVKA